MDSVLSLGCYNSLPQNGGLHEQTFIYLNSGVWESKIKVLADWVLVEACFPGLHTAAFLLNFYIWFSYEGTNPIMGIPPHDLMSA